MIDPRSLNDRRLTELAIDYALSLGIRRLTLTRFKVVTESPVRGMRVHWPTLERYPWRTRMEFDGTDTVIVEIGKRPRRG